jgi:hypothetical protein
MAMREDVTIPDFGEVEAYQLIRLSRMSEREGEESANEKETEPPQEMA